MQNKSLKFSSLVLLSLISPMALAVFNVTVTLNNQTKTFSFKDAETALSTDQTKFRDDFRNPDTGQLPNSSIGQITQFNFDGLPLTLIKTGSETVVMAPESGVSSDFLTFTGNNSEITTQIESLLTTGVAPKTAKAGLNFANRKDVEQIIAEQIPASNKQLANKLTNDLTATKTTKVTKDTTPETEAKEVEKISQQIFQTLAVAEDSPIRDDAILAKFNPTAAIAGNPASLMGTMVDQIFTQNGLENRYSSQRNSATASADYDKTQGSTFSGGFQYGYYNLAGRSVHTLTAPLSYAYRFNSTNQVIVSLPLTYVDTEGNSSYQIAGGLAYKYNIMQNWSLTPSVNYGYRGTPKTNNGLARTEGHILSGSVTSKYIYDLDPKDRTSLKIGLMNMIGYFQALDMETDIGNRTYQTSGNVNNTVLKNGISISKRIDVFDVSGFITDTEYFGTDLYFEQYNEIGASVSTDRAGTYFDSLSMNVNYLFSLADNKDLDGFRLNFKFTF